MSFVREGEGEGSAEWAQQNKGPQVLAISWAVVATSTIFVAARLFVRGFVAKRLRPDDLIVVCSLICAYVATALSTLAVSYGDGKHFSLLTPTQQLRTVKWTIAGFCPGVMSFGLPKLAVIYLLTQLLSPGRVHWCCLWIMGIWAQLTLLAMAGLLVGQCRPVSALWDSPIADRSKCWDTQVVLCFSIYAGAYSAFVDIYLAVYPAVVLFRLQMSMKKKFALSAAFGVGFISGLVAIYRTSRVPLLASPDFSYDTSDLTIWTIVEGCTMIIATSIPNLKPILDLIRGRDIFGSSQNDGNDNKKNNRKPRPGPGSDDFARQQDPVGHADFDIHRPPRARCRRPALPYDKALMELEMELGLMGRRESERSGPTPPPPSQVRSPARSQVSIHAAEDGRLSGLPGRGRDGGAVDARFDRILGTHGVTVSYGDGPGSSRATTGWAGSMV